MDGPLAGLRVLDLSGMIAGGFATMTLADHGADVVMVEHPEHGDPIREWPPFDGDHSLWWKALARNKRCVTLDMKTDEGTALVHELAAEADVVIENFRPGTLESWGLGPDALHETNEDLVVVRISGYGQDGPLAEQPGFGTVAEAMSGFAHVNGFPDSEPLLPPISLADLAAGQYATMGALFGVFDTLTGGTGRVVDVSLMESLFRMFPSVPEKYDRLDEVDERTGNRHPNAAPRNVYEASDGYVALSASSQAIFERVAECIGHPELVEQDRFATNRKRVEHAAELDDYIEAWMQERTATEAVESLTDADAVASEIYDISDIRADAQYDARDAVVTVDDADLGPVETHGIVPKFSGETREIDRLGPSHGEHNDEVYLGELALDEDTYTSLREEGVI
ncbi:CoA transferase [Halosegnis rubeus]|jgi:formyl-CoA transferase|uniref:CoA transferase n=1 Tax=Halosegnis rubeus TaxID=2212850 RepID=A0A5N5UKQ7_9EURY|nr:CoA transferase [Halosegnis rubeus]KAB7513888.1 CoA transferase [Halosegnis rubeus]KAB7514290.1 CoA transferase [Halosegnis rubeus]KAB7518860.1 CoA transferase [Halosegnis rubeus]